MNDPVDENEFNDDALDYNMAVCKKNFILKYQFKTMKILKDDK